MRPGKIGGLDGIQFIMFRRGGDFHLAACRGNAKGCNVQSKQRQKLGPCPDCVPCEDPNETLEQVAGRLNRGDA